MIQVRYGLAGSSIAVLYVEERAPEIPAIAHVDVMPQRQVVQEGNGIVHVRVASSHKVRIGVGRAIVLPAARSSHPAGQVPVAKVRNVLRVRVSRHSECRMPSLLVRNRLPFEPSADRILLRQLALYLELGPAVNSFVNVLLGALVELDILHRIRRPIVDWRLGPVRLELLERIQRANVGAHADTEGRVHNQAVECRVGYAVGVLTERESEVGSYWNMLGAVDDRQGLGVAVLEEDGSLALRSARSELVGECNEIPLAFLVPSEVKVRPHVDVIGGLVVGAEMVVAVSLPHGKRSVSELVDVFPGVIERHPCDDVPGLRLAALLPEWVEGGVPEPKCIAVLRGDLGHGVV